MPDVLSPAQSVAASQLSRMRGMTGLYHRRFFFDIQFTVVVVLATGAAGFAIDDRLFLAVPFVALLGATQTAFDASYLIFARQYAARLERFLNDSLGQRVLVAADLESRYLFPLDVPKTVTLRFGKDFTWFGFMTAFYTLLGVLSFVAGFGLGITALSNRGQLVYTLVLGLLTVASLGTGLWWFNGGEGERRLRSVLDDAFGDPSGT
ncbi:MAG: hypothetical protein OEM97_03545 [Acidimicrobiia bacterium]|nr:hypothetical protein [Acidimicrobiia bacterium]